MRFLLALSFLAASMTTQAQTIQLASTRDRSRPLLVFAPRADDPRLLKQLDLLSSSDLKERDMIVIILPAEGTPRPAGKVETAVLTPEDAISARRRFHVKPPDFTVVLLGKDGGSKLHSQMPVTMEQLNNLIDSMPMRQQEMQSRPTH